MNQKSLHFAPSDIHKKLVSFYLQKKVGKVASFHLVCNFSSLEPLFLSFFLKFASKETEKEEPKIMGKQIFRKPKSFLFSSKIHEIGKKFSGRDH